MGIIDIEQVQLSEQHDQITVIHETSVSDPYFYAPLDLNPINTHNHTGFLYISNQPQYLANVTVHVSPGTVQSGQPVLITASATDNLGNPIPNILLSISYQEGNNLPQVLANIMTNDSGESYYTFRPTQSGMVIARYRDKSARASVCIYAPVMVPAHLSVSVSPHVLKIVGCQIQGGPVVVDIAMSDYLWNPVNGVVTLAYMDSSGAHTVTLNVVSGATEFNYTPIAVVDQIKFVATFDDILSAWDTLNLVSGGE